jgi:hypothetical protein
VQVRPSATQAKVCNGVNSCHSVMRAGMSAPPCRLPKAVRLLPASAGHGAARRNCPPWVEICREDATGKRQLSAVTALNRPFRSRPNQAGLEGSFRPSARRAIS